MNARSSQGAVAWAVSLLTLPEISLPLYWAFGHTKFYGYVDARRADNVKLRHIAEELARDEYGGHHVQLEGEEGAVAMLERFADVPFLDRNGVQLLIDGTVAFPRMLESIRQAKEYVLLQFFIVRDDDLGREFAEALADAAARGIRVLFLIDEVGSYSLSRRYLKRLDDAGIVARKFETTRGITNKFRINFRNHRKIVVVDGREAYLGGLNIGDEYIGQSSKFGPWRDTIVLIEGPAVQAAQLSFLEDWYWVTKEVPDLRWKMAAAPEGQIRVLVLPTGPADDLESCALMFAHCINSAKHRCWIASPYFVPDPEVMVALQLAALRGVDVRILLPEKADHMLVWLSSFYFGRESRKAGVTIYRYQPGFLHQKVMLVDEYLAAVGTANLDNRSFRLNFEITALVVDRGFSGEVEAMLLHDFENSRQVEAGELGRKPLWFRVAVLMARLFAPVQ